MSICVECGIPATKGSMKHPYCKKCFKDIWDNDINRYFEWLEIHPWMEHHPGKEEK